DHEARVGRFEAVVVIGVDALGPAIPYLALRLRSRFDPGGGFDLQGDDHSVEQRLLVLEVVIEGAPRHPRGARDRLDPRRLIALALKSFPAGRQQRLPRGLDVVLAAGSIASGFLHALDIPLDA